MHYTKKEKEFIQTVREYYRRHKRRKLPWRQFPKGLQDDKRAYRILVSEIMLQQTQVDRVIPKYTEFLRMFPTVETLARAPLGSVLRLWQGLGYNRRAKMLHECGKALVKTHKGRFPRTMEGLTSLPGIGPYTAGAVLAFAFNTGTPIIETNIRSVYLHHFFDGLYDVGDDELMPLIERTLDVKNPRTWYYALMDYGSFIKKMYGNPNRRSRHHTRQSAFKGSDREIRGALLALLTEKPHTRTALLLHLKRFSDIRVDAQLHALTKEGLISYRGRMYHLGE